MHAVMNLMNMMIFAIIAESILILRMSKNCVGAPRSACAPLALHFRQGRHCRGRGVETLAKRGVRQGCPPPPAPATSSTAHPCTPSLAPRSLRTTLWCSFNVSTNSCATVWQQRGKSRFVALQDQHVAPLCAALAPTALTRRC